jgi:RNA polymerase sigma-70 factor (ECF subfamily)
VGEPSDSELLQLARQGNPTAFGTLIRRHDRYLYRLARSILLDDHEAEDVVQETYIRAFTGLVGFRGDANLRTWLTRITLNLAVRRRRQKRASVDLDELQAAQERHPGRADISALSSPDRDPERAAAQGEIRRLLERAIDSLPAQFRTVFVLRDVEDVSVARTAELLGIREETVKTRLHRARRILRETLGEQLASVLKDVFPFERPRCDQLVARVLENLGFSQPKRRARQH